MRRLPLPTFQPGVLSASLILLALLLPAASQAQDSTVFAPHFISWPTGRYPNAIASGDLNGDLKPDLVTVNSDSTASVLINTSNGTFPTFSTVPLGNFGALCALADFNQDTKLDLLVYKGGNALAFFPGNGSGGFGARVEIVAPSGIQMLFVADINSDGKPDIVAAGGSAARVYVWLGNGDGTFARKPDLVCSSFCHAVAVGDLNADNKPDIVASVNSAVLSEFPGNGDGTFGARADFAAASQPEGLVISDVTGDGKPDVVQACYGGSPPQILCVYPGLGNGSFGARIDLTGGSSGAQLVVLDIDGDGVRDVVGGGQSSSTNFVTLWHGLGGGSFALPVNTVSPPLSSATGQSQGMALADFDGDGKLDLAQCWATGSGSGLVAIQRGNGMSGFGNPTLISNSQPSDVSAADLNGDGKADLLAISPISSQSLLSEWLALPAGGYGARQDFVVGNQPAALGIADFTLDGKLDVVTADSYGNSVTLLRGLGNGAFGPTITLDAGLGPRALAIGDVNGDGRPDLAVANEIGSSVQVFLDSGAGALIPGATYTTAYEPLAVALADVNQDGKLDLVVDENNGRSVSVRLGWGDGTFGPRTETYMPGPSYMMAVGDLNGDGYPDLVVGTHVMYGIGDGTFGVANSLAGVTTLGCEAIFDANGDGVGDLAVSQGDSIGLFLGSVGGPLKPVKFYPSSILPTSMRAVDIDGDGKRDLVLASQSMNEICILKNVSTASVATVGKGSTPKLQIAVSPNPGRGQIRARFSSARSGYSYLDVFSPSGQRVAVRTGGWIEAGSHVLAWDGKADGGATAPSGVYLMRIRCGSESSSRPFVWLR